MLENRLHIPQRGPEVGAGPGPQAMPQLADRLARLAEGRDEVTMGDIVRTIGAQGHAPLLMVVALLMILPIGMIPGVGGALGALAAIIGAQMLRGRRGVWLPKFLRDRAVPAERVQKLAQRVRPWAEWLRRRLHVRLEAISGGRVSLGLIAIILVISGSSLIVVGAVPVATPLFGVPIAVFAFGILARDGAVVLAGYGLLGLVVYILTFADVWMPG